MRFIIVLLPGVLRTVQSTISFSVQSAYCARKVFTGLSYNWMCSRAVCIRRIPHIDLQHSIPENGVAFARVISTRANLTSGSANHVLCELHLLPRLSATHAPSRCWSTFSLTFAQFPSLLFLQGVSLHQDFGLGETSSSPSAPGAGVLTKLVGSWSIIHVLSLHATSHLCKSVISTRRVNVSFRHILSTSAFLVIYVVKAFFNNNGRPIVPWLL
ncbi:hypothetical protein AcV5_005306 [Taiwanofungus camphoratus]|nr:hypothetical protein AcV5_005306 [Antrodia cinnamomea]